MENLPETLRGNWSLFTERDRELLLKLIELDQAHLFESWDASPTAFVEEKHSFMSQLHRLDQSYPGGLATYITRARDLLLDAQAGRNPLDGWNPQIPTNGENLELFTERFNMFEEIGFRELAHCGFILVAGGLGERLGYSGIKVELPVESSTGVCYLGHYISQILSIQASLSAILSQPLFLPLAIMVSDDTHDKTIDLLERHSYFGMATDQVTILKQEKVAALLSSDARIATLSTYEIDTKPHGHGDVHSLMHSTGTAKRWQADLGIQWCVFFQDTNGIGFTTLAAMVGVSKHHDLDVNSMTVPRFAKQAVGAITKLVHNDGRTMTVNVEYNQLDPLLRATINPEGDVNDPTTGHSPFPGNINQLVFKLSHYCTTLERTAGVVGEFVNPKYTDSTRTTFKKPTRVECMMQDYPKALEASAKVGFTIAPLWLCYSPCKNNSTDAAIAVASGVPGSCAFTSESDQYNCAAEILRSIGVSAPRAQEVSFLGISALPGPRIVFHPSFGVFPCSIKHRFPNPHFVEISPNSTLILKGDITVESLTLNGALIVEACPGTSVTIRAGRKEVEGVEIFEGVVNRGHELIALDSNDQSATEIDKMRGYRLQVHEEKVVTTKGRHEHERAFVFSGDHLIPLSCSGGEEMSGVPIEGTPVSESNNSGVCNLTCFKTLFSMK